MSSKPINKLEEVRSDHRAWRRTFEAEKAGTLAVGVHTTDPEEVEIAARVLESTSPLSTNQF